MKKYLILLLVLARALLSGCGSKDAEAAKLSFAESASIETIQKLNGKTVSLTGYMATLSPLEGDYIYLMNLPFQSCPFCVPNTQQLANTMAVYAAKGTKFDYTDRPVKITGRMDVGQYSDDYGYEYNYRIVDAKYEIVDLSQVSEEYALYQSLAEDGVIAAGLRFSVRSFDKRDGILERIALEDRLLVQGRIRIAPHLEKWHEALQMAVWDGSAWEKGEWVRLDDGSYPLDCLDSMEYGLYPLKQWIA